MQIVTMLISRENSETIGRQQEHNCTTRDWSLLAVGCTYVTLCSPTVHSTFRSSVLPPSSGKKMNIKKRRGSRRFRNKILIQSLATFAAGVALRP
jgi:hypothetical protein